jgi:hypothetical protein
MAMAFLEEALMADMMLSTGSYFEYSPDCIDSQ